MLSARGAVAAVLSALCAAAPAASAHEGNPNYRSQVRAIAPSIEGVEAQIINYDDRIELRNDSGETVVVRGYRGEPYLRFSPDGVVEANRRSPARYLNEDRFAQVEVPAGAEPSAAPEWEVVARNGRYEWHDHRIHWMGQGVPPRVRDNEEARTEVFDWKLPLAVAGRESVVRGSLVWLGKDSGGCPAAAAVSLAAAVLAGGVLVAVARRRRRRPEVEAW